MVRVMARVRLTVRVRGWKIVRVGVAFVVVLGLGLGLVLRLGLK